MGGFGGAYRAVVTMDLVEVSLQEFGGNLEAKKAEAGDRVALSGSLAEKAQQSLLGL